MGERILVIEDNLINLELICYLLKAFRFTVICATDGEEGIRLAQETKADLIICDIHLPKTDGYEVARCLKNDPGLRGTPLVAVTALAMVGDREKLIAAGFDSYISKPINPEIFVDQIKAVMVKKNK